MTRVAVRLSRLEAAVPRPVPVPAYDLSRLTPDQLARAGELRRRVDAVGMAGLTDGEVDEGATISGILLAPAWPVPENARAAPIGWGTTWRRPWSGG